VKKEKPIAATIDFS